MESIHHSILNSRYYRLHDTEGEELVPPLRREFYKLAQRAASARTASLDEALHAVIKRPMADQEAWYVGRLRTTCKTHKPAGEVTWRNLHCASSSAIGGLSKWLDMEATLILARYSHILKSREQFVQLVSGPNFHEVGLDDDLTMLRLDVK